MPLLIPESRPDILRARIEELERFVERFIDLGYESSDHTALIHTALTDLHDEALALLPERR